MRARDIDALGKGRGGQPGGSQRFEWHVRRHRPGEAVELGGFTLAVEDAQLRSCLDEKINYLTADRRISYAEWAADPEVFMRRAVEMRLQDAN